MLLVQTHKLENTELRWSPPRFLPKSMDAVEAASFLPTANKLTLRALKCLMTIAAGCCII